MQPCDFRVRMVSLGREPLDRYLKGMTFHLKEVREGALSIYKGREFQAGHLTVYKCKGPKVGVWRVFKKHR